MPSKDFSWYVSWWLRRRRFALFQSIVAPIDKPIRVLDVGGSEEYWEQMDFISPDVINLTILNLEAHTSARANVHFVIGDARRLPFGGHAFDIVFSNAVLEHVGSEDDQSAAAAEIARVGRHLLVMVPNRYWPIEVHTLLPFYQFWPRWLQHGVLGRTWKLTHFRDAGHARRVMDSVRLPSMIDMRRWFPTASYRKERILGISKTLIAYC